MENNTYIVITQYLENYGAHDEQNPTHYWKPKGGFCYRVNLPEHGRGYDAAAIVSIQECVNNFHCAEYVVNFMPEDEWLESISDESEEYHNFLISDVRDVQVHVN